MGWLALALIAGYCCVGDASAETWVVPDQFVTIQAAIDASLDADTILVRPGTYVENLLILGKSIALRSLGGPDVTVIDGRFPPRPDTLSVLCALGAENLVLTGFTFTNGLGSSFPDLIGVGGGLVLIGGSATIQDCVIQGNYAEYEGGGVYVFASTVDFSACTIRNNHCSGNGGGLRTRHASPRLERCTIIGNRAYDGGAVYKSLGVPEFIECTIRENISDRGWVLSGSGRYVRTVVVDNGFVAPPSTHQVGILTATSIESCTIVRNRSYWLTVLMYNGTMSGSIVAFNESRGVMCDGAGAFECSDVFGNQGGDELCGTDLGSNFSLDPLLCEDYTLDSASPCSPAHSPTGCGLIGALGIGCGAAVEPATWGRIKALGRSR
jgi:hypothetical protein